MRKNELSFFIIAKFKVRYCILVVLLYIYPIAILMPAQNVLIIDDRTTGDYHSTSGNEWYLVTDGVMGGVSKGQLSPDVVESRPCLRMQGDVSLDDDGGFIQMVLNLSDDILQNVSDYTGMVLEIYGNEEQYNLHIRTQDTSLPWQSYRITFMAAPEWKTLYLPFAEFTPYRIDKMLDIRRIKRIGVVAIGRVFHANVCIGKVGLFRQE